MNRRLVAFDRSTTSSTYTRTSTKIFLRSQSSRERRHRRRNLQVATTPQPSRCISQRRVAASRYSLLCCRHSVVAFLWSEIVSDSLSSVFLRFNFFPCRLRRRTTLGRTSRKCSTSRSRTPRRTSVSLPTRTRGRSRRGRLESSSWYTATIRDSSFRQGSRLSRCEYTGFVKIIFDVALQKTKTKWNDKY